MPITARRFTAMALGVGFLALVGCRNSSPSTSGTDNVAANSPAGKEEHRTPGSDAATARDTTVSFQRAPARDATNIEMGQPGLSEAQVKSLAQVPVILPALESPAMTAPSREVVTAKVGNPGLLIGYPQVEAKASEALSNFGAACQLYLTLAVAGNPELGRTPHLNALWRGRRELELTSLRLTREEAGKIAKLSGATHTAVGTIAGTGNKVTLTYQVHTADGGPVGKPITATGSRDEIIHRLPALAMEMSQVFGIQSAAAPVLNVPATDMEAVGEVLQAEKPTEAQAKRLSALVDTNPLAAILYLGSYESLGNRSVFNRTMTALLASFPQSALAYGQVGMLNASALQAQGKKLTELFAKYPKNYVLAHTEVWLSRSLNDATRERKAANRAVANAPQNPDAYLTLGRTLAQSAHRVRNNRPVEMLAPTEASFLAQVYPQWLKALRRAVEADPKYGIAWLHVAEAATFAEERSSAEEAWEKAQALKVNPFDLYGWGLQMFHRKWGGDSTRLREVGEEATEATYANAFQATAMVQQLRNAELNDLAQQMAETYTKRYRDAVAKDARSAQAHYDLALALKATGDVMAAIDEFEAVTRLRPTDAEAFYDLGTALAEKGLNSRAVTALQETTRLAPNHERAYAMLGWTLKHMNRLPEAETALKKAVALQKDYPQAHCVLGTVYVTQYQQGDKSKYAAAISAYEKALAQWPFFPEAYNNRMMLYMDRSEWEKAQHDAEAYLRLKPQSYGHWVNLGHCFLMQKKWKEAEDTSRQAVSLNANDALCHANLAHALLMQKQWEEAKSEGETALQLSAGRNPEMEQELQAMLDTAGK